MSGVPHDSISSVTEKRPALEVPERTNNLEHVKTSDQGSPLRIAVVGGGMGGLSLAVGLLNYPHIDVQVYEAAHKFAEIGAGVAFGPNAQRALAMLGPHVKEAFLRQATHNLWDSHSKTWFTFRVCTAGPESGRFIAAPENETGQCTVHRAHFLDEFVSLIPPERAHFGKRLIGLEDRSEAGGHVVLHFKDGTSVEADAVVGADGVHSYTREYLLGVDHPAQRPVYTGTVAFRGLVPMDRAAAVLGKEVAENSTMLSSQDKFLQLYPVNFGEMVSTTAVSYRHKTWDHKDWVIPTDVEHVLEEFQGWDEKVLDFLKLLEHPSIWSLWDHPPAPYFNKGRICMIGDGAHATTPFQGQGAGQAIEDSLVLSTLLGKIHDVRQIDNAFAAYDKVRRLRSQKNVTTSRASGLALTFQHPEIGDNLDVLAKNLAGRMDWLWGHDLDKQNKDAVEYMDKLNSTK